MKPPSDLEIYLRDKSDAGSVVDTEQAFSISKQRALEKLATFQLPFEGAWALKMVQSAVASKSVERLIIQLEVKAGLFHFHGRVDFTQDELERAFLDPEYSERKELLHLVTALRVVGISQKQPFWVTFKDRAEALVWNGKELARAPRSSQPADSLSDAEEAFLKVRVSNFPITEERGFFGFGTAPKAAARNAALTKVLSNFAHTSPIPLTLDGRRLDALEHDFRHGWSDQSQLLMLCFREADLPELGLPPFTGSTLTNPEIAIDEYLAIASQELRQVHRERNRFTLAFLLSAHLKKVESGRSFVWSDSADISLCNWVHDGVIISREELGTSAHFCSVGCYLSAQDLRTDLSGFSLAESEAKRERLRQAKSLVASGLEEAARLDFEKMRRSIKEYERSNAAFMLVFGALGFVVNPFAGLALAGVGLWGLFSRGGNGQSRGHQIAESITRLKEDLSRPSER